MVWSLFFVLSLFLNKNNVVEPSKNTLGKKDFDGVWIGKITRDEGGGARAEFDMQLDVEQDGKRVKGVSTVSFKKNNQLFTAKMEFMGKASGQFLRYLETRIIESDSIPNTEWCIKKAELILKTKDGRPALEGLWEGITTGANSCKPGRILLQRPKPRV